MKCRPLCYFFCFLSLFFRQSDGLDASQLTTEERKELYIDTVFDQIGITSIVFHEPCSCGPRNFPILARPTVDTYQIPIGGPVPLWPYTGRELPTGTISNMMCVITCDKNSTADFQLAQLVRILYLTHDTNLQDEILLNIQEATDDGELKFSLTKDEKSQVYWSENHIILWSSSDYLIRQRRNESMDGTDLEKFILHFLDTKIRYGFYEFFSTTYNQFTLAALLNLRDFSLNPIILTKSESVVNRLLKENVLIINDKGFSYPAAGRNYPRRYINFQFYCIVWMLTGKGAPLTEEAWRFDYIGSFLATSSINLESAALSWAPFINTKLQNGHKVDEMKFIHRDLAFTDRVMFQWSAGGYFHPNVVLDTINLSNMFNLSEHAEWEFFKFFLLLPSFLVEILSKILSGFSKGTIISGADINIYKHNGVVLTSIQDFNGGLMGTQIWPWCATVDDIAVWTQSGVVDKNFYQKGEVVTSTMSNTHLPHVNQDGNVALITYRPKNDILLVSNLNWLSWLTGVTMETQVSLFFPVKRFDQVLEDRKWIIGRKGNSYVAIWRDGGDAQHQCSENDMDCMPYYYSNPLYGIRAQVWAVVIGNEETHGSFSKFLDMIEQSEVKSSTYSHWTGIAYATSLYADGKELNAEN